MKKITLIILAFTLNVSFAQVIFSEDFSSYDVGPMAKGNGETVWEAASRKDDAVDCAGIEVPARADMEIRDDGNGNKYAAFFDNGTNCKNSNQSIVHFAAFMNRALPELQPEQFYTITMDAWFISNATPTHKAINVQIRTSPSGYATRVPYFKYGNDGTSATANSGDNKTLYFGPNDGYDFLETSGVVKNYVGVFKPDMDYDFSGGDTYYLTLVKGTNVFPGDNNGLDGPADTTSHYAIDNITIEVGNLLLSTAELKKFGFSLFPNPTTGLLNFKANEAVSQIEIFNTLGQEVYNKALNVTNGQLDVSHLNNGIYSIKATINGQSGTMKFIKK